MSFGQWLSGALTDASGASTQLHAIPTPTLAVLCDLDGTLVESSELWHNAYSAVAKELGATLPAGFWSRIAGTTVEASVTVLLAEAGRDPDPSSVGWAARALVSHVQRLLDGGACAPWRPGARELLADVRVAGVPIALVTTTWRSVAMRITRDHALSFDAVVYGDEVTRGKPAPDQYLLAAHRLGIQPRDCVVIEDSLPGVHAAEAADMRVLVAPSGAAIAPARGRCVRKTLRAATFEELTGIARRPDVRRKARPP